MIRPATSLAPTTETRDCRVTAGAWSLRARMAPLERNGAIYAWEVSVIAINEPLGLRAERTRTFYGARQASEWFGYAIGQLPRR